MMVFIESFVLIEDETYPSGVLSLRNFKCYGGMQFVLCHFEKHRAVRERDRDAAYVWVQEASLIV